MSDVNEWAKYTHALGYLARASRIPRRAEGETVLREHVPVGARRILDLGSGDGQLLALLKKDRPQLEGVALDFSPLMVDLARHRFAGDKTISVISHDLDIPLPQLGRFDAIISSLAIHHCSHERKQALYAEVYEFLELGGIFCNLDHVASPTPRLHQHFMESIGESVEREDPSNKLLDVETQLVWLRKIGFQDVDCYWKWLELALMVGVKPQ